LYPKPLFQILDKPMNQLVMTVRNPQPQQQAPALATAPAPAPAVAQDSALTSVQGK
jgi:hypothetical protein